MKIKTAFLALLSAGLILNASPIVKNKTMERFNIKNNTLKEQPKLANGNTVPTETTTETVAYYPQKNFDMKSFFENFYVHQPANTIGSCGYVSLISLLCYYDTFYDDRIVPEKYERNGESKSSFEEAKLESPGVVRDAFDKNGTKTYRKYCHETMDYNLQSELTVLNNQICGTDKDGFYPGSVDKRYFNEGIGSIEEEHGYRDLLPAFFEKYNSPVSFDIHESIREGTYFDWSENLRLENIILNELKQGKPVIATVANLRGTGPKLEKDAYHSVLVYDYDEWEDEDGTNYRLYANFGKLDEGHTHCQLLGGDHNFEDIIDVFTFDYLGYDCVRSDNYIVNGKGYCGTELNDDIVFEVPVSSATVPPTFYWQKDINNPDEYYVCYIYEENEQYPIVRVEMTDNYVSLGLDDWTWILNSCQLYNTRYLNFTMQRCNTPYNFKRTFTKVVNPNGAKLKSLFIIPPYWQFGNNFLNQEISKNYNFGGVALNTKLLRCCNMYNQRIILSPSRNTGGVAYFDFSFVSHYIDSIEFEISMLNSSQFAHVYDHKAVVEYFDGISYKQLFDLFNDIQISMDYTKPNHLFIDFPCRVQEFRIYTSSFSTGNNDEGMMALSAILFNIH